jgi:hypothetical protein
MTANVRKLFLGMKGYGLKAGLAHRSSVDRDERTARRLLSNQPGCWLAACGCRGTRIRARRTIQPEFRSSVCRRGTPGDRRRACEVPGGRLFEFRADVVAGPLALRLRWFVPPARFERRAEFAERCRFPASSFVVSMRRQMGPGSNKEADDAGYGVRESH